eukprot:jgi/Tetstr1/422925/TSEL_013706.t1
MALFARAGEELRAAMGCKAEAQAAEMAEGQAARDGETAELATAEEPRLRARADEVGATSVGLEPGCGGLACGVELEASVAEAAGKLAEAERAMAAHSVAGEAELVEALETRDAEAEWTAAGGEVAARRAAERALADAEADKEREAEARAAVEEMVRCVGRVAE